MKLNDRANVKKFYTGAVFLSAMILCMSLNLIGPLLNDIMSGYGIALGNGGSMTLLQYFGGVIAILALSGMIDRFYKPLVLVICLAVLAFTQFFISTVPSYPVFMGMFLLFGAAISILDMVENAVISDIYQENRNTPLSILHGASGLGAAALPLIIGSSLDSGSHWSRIYLLSGILFSTALALNAVGVLIVRKRMPELRPKPVASREKGRAKRFLKDKYVWLAVASQFFYGTCQGGLTVWVVKYCTETFALDSVLLNTLPLSTFWFGTMVTRMLTGLAPRFRAIKTKSHIVYGGIFAAVSFAAGILLHDYYCLVVGTFLVGVFSGAVLPRLVGLVSSWYPESSGLASSSQFVALYTAFGLTPMIMGPIAAGLGMSVMIFVPAVGSLISGLLGLRLPLEGRRSKV